jgi:hypothetical protein
MLKRIGLLFLALTILVAAVGFSAQPASAASCTQWYTVKPGDTLYKIGVKFGVSWTYLAKINHIPNPNKIYAGQTICVSTTSGGQTSYPAKTPYFFIQSVVRNDTVTIKGYNYPPNTKFNVYMGRYGSAGAGGYFVASFNSGQGGTIVKTFNIPPEMYGASKIAIRTQGSVYYAYNWFWNNTAVAP